MKRYFLIIIVTILLMPGIKINAMGIRQTTLIWNDGKNQYDCPKIDQFSVNSLSFNGCIRKNSTSTLWPYNIAKFYLPKPTYDTNKTYDLDFIAFIQANEGVQTFARFNGNNYCETVSESSNLVWFSCKNVTFVNNDSNYILLSFKKLESVSTGWSTGLSNINVSQSGDSNRDDIIEYIKILENNMKNQNQAIIDNQDKNNQEQIDNANQNHQQTMDTITSTDTSGANDSANGFFNDFSDSDHGGLSGIITKPLVMIKRFINPLPTCYSVGEFAIMGTPVSLPCANKFLSEKGMDRFVYYYNLIMGGLIAYGACRGLFKTIQDLKNPDDDKIEVMDL